MLKSQINQDKNKKITLRNSFKFKIFIIVFTILACAFFSYLNYQTSLFDSGSHIYKAGYSWTAPTLIADYNFSIYKPNIQYRAELQNARDSVSPVFILDSYAEINFSERIREITENLTLHNDSLLLSYTTSDKIRKFFEQSEANQTAEITKIKSHLIPFAKKMYAAGYINQSLDKFKLNDVFTVRLLSNFEYLIERNAVFDKQKYSIRLQQFCSDIFTVETSSMIVEIAFKIAQPNLVFSDELTARAAKLAEQSVKKTLGIVRKGETIIERGERLTDDKILKIKSYQDSNIEQEDKQFSFLNLLGSIGHVTILYSILLLFLIIIKTRIWVDNYHVLLLSGLLVLISFMGWLSFQIQLVNPNAPIEYLIILPAFSMFVAITFDSRTAFYTTVSMALMLAGVRGNDYFVGLTMLFSGTIAAYAVKDIQDRRQLFNSILFIFIGFGLSILVISFERGFDFNIVMPQLFFAIINAITAPVITFALLFYINKYSKKIITNLKLQDLTNEEHPLLLELRTKAPGTFEHSREVSKLAEIAAVTIDANYLLAKVGALFHDVGKIANPEFFTENKEQYKNSDKELSPLYSAKIIKEHIASGLELAAEAGLPQQIIDFIPQHHGTTLIKHFYNVALNEAKNTGDEVNPADFRYAGPKPQTKEAAIVMLCDSAEAISKSATDMKQFITIFEAMIDERIKDGQFDETTINLQEIKRIKEILYSEIKGKIHTRTQYASADTVSTKKENEQ